MLDVSELSVLQFPGPTTPAKDAPGRVNEKNKRVVWGGRKYSGFDSRAPKVLHEIHAAFLQTELTVAEFEERVGMAPGYYRLMRREKFNPTLAMIEAMAEVVGLRVVAVAKPAADAYEGFAGYD